MGLEEIVEVLTIERDSLRKENAYFANQIEWMKEQIKQLRNFEVENVALEEELRDAKQRNHEFLTLLQTEELFKSETKNFENGLKSNLQNQETANIFNERVKESNVRSRI